MNLPNGITFEQWIAAQSILPDAWKPGQTEVQTCILCSQPHSETINVPPPAVTDELLMAILREGERQQGFTFFLVIGNRCRDSLSLDAAIILAATSLDKDK
jgi:hypothetical protein